MAIRGNYVWFLAIVTKFKGLGGTNKWRGGWFQGHHMGMASHKGDEGWSKLKLLLSLYLQIQETLQPKVYTRAPSLRNIFMVLKHS